jgi:phosphomannomutase
MSIDPSRLAAIFKAYDIRGTVPDQLDDEIAEAVGAAFARYVRTAGGPAERVLIGWDMRPSSVPLSEAFGRGVRSQGLDTARMGLCSTDEVFFAAGHFDAPACQFTASHNPAGYNGMKMALAGAKPVGQDTGLDQIRTWAAEGSAPVEQPGVDGEIDALGPFVEHVCSFVDPSVIDGMRIVADAANGMGGLIAPAVFDALPVELDLLYGELDGTFPNHPADPIQPENLVDLQERVVATGAAVGLAFDGDADRVFLVDDAGEPVSGSITTAIVAVDQLGRHPGSTILHNLICSKVVPEVIREHGGTPVRTRVGHSFIKAVMAETGAAFGGEHSGHYYFRDNYRADSGIIAALSVLQVMAEAGRPLSELRKPFERYAASGEINTTVADAHRVIEHIAEHFGRADQDHLDGLTVDLGDWWFNLRPSNTEPLLRLNVEAADRAACDARVAELLQLITSAPGGPEELT